MSREFDHDMSTDVSGSYDGSAVTVSTGPGTAALANDGIAVNDTAIPGTGDYWGLIGFTAIPGADSAQAGPAIAAIPDVNGPDGIIFILVTGANDAVIVDWITEYVNGTTYNSNDTDQNVSIGTGYSAPGEIGFAVDVSAETIAFWLNPSTNDEPTSVTAWNGVAPGATLDFGAAGYTLPGRHIGWGHWNTGGTAGTITRITGGEIGGGAATITGTGAPAAQSSAVAGAGDITKTGTGAAAAQNSTVTGSGILSVTGTGVLAAQASAVVGAGTVIGTVSVELTAANSRNLETVAGVSVGVITGIVWEWYDTPGSTAGEPTDSGTFNTSALGEATITVNNSSLGAGQFGQLILYHPSDPDIRATLRVPVS